MNAPCIAVVGTGAVARAVVRRHADIGGRVVSVLSRDAGRATALAETCGAVVATSAAQLRGADVVLVCVPDRAIAAVGAVLVAALGGSGPLLLHTSGAAAGAELVRGRSEDAAVGSLHPLQSLPASAPSAATDGALAARLVGAHWFHEGAGDATARSLVTAWGGVFHSLAPGGKALYHAGAAILSNHAVALFSDATRLLALAGVPADASRPALAALLAGTAANLASVGVPAALTGPVARGDVATVRRHVEALRAAAPEMLASYTAMARRAVAVARAKGSIGDEAAAAIEAALAD